MYKNEFESNLTTSLYKLNNGVLVLYFKPQIFFNSENCLVSLLVPVVMHICRLLLVISHFWLAAHVKLHMF